MMYNCMPNPSEAPMSVALMSCLLAARRRYGTLPAARACW